MSIGRRIGPGTVWLLTAPAALPPAILFLLGPHTIFATNTGEFAAGFGELAFPWLLQTATLYWLVLLAVGFAIALVSDRLARVYASALFGLGLLLWAQGHLWNPDYGALTGDDPNLAAHAWRGPYEIAGWGMVLVISAVFFRGVSRIAPFASVAFMGVQLVAGVTVHAKPARPEQGQWTEPPAAIYQLSATTNVIHIVLDAFQSDVFTELVEADRGAFDPRFAGFEHFADHAGTFPTTAFSMVAMLTGKEYRNRTPVREFTRGAFQEFSVFRSLGGAGYEIDVISIVPSAFINDWVGPATSPDWPGARYRLRMPFVSRDDYRETTARQLLELSLFRHVPHPLKAAAVEKPDAFYRVLGVGAQESVARTRRYPSSNAAAFLEHFTEELTVARGRPVYKLLHVGLPHRPVVLDAECRFIGVKKVSRETYAGQARCAIERVGALLDRLRALGVYDRSLIIVSSDHGTGLEPPGLNGHSPALTRERVSLMAGTAKALMLVKPPGRDGALSVSHAPTSHVDLPATVLDLLDLRADAPAESESMFRRHREVPRTRSFGMYDLRERFPTKYFTRMDVMSIEGRVVDAAGWIPRESIWRPDMRLEADEIDFGTDAGDPHVGEGWAEHRRESLWRSGEVTFVRALARRAVIFATLPAGESELVLRVASAYRAPQTLRVDVDGRTVARLTLLSRDRYGDFIIVAPADRERPAISEIALHFETQVPEGYQFKLDRLRILGRKP